MLFRGPPTQCLALGIIWFVLLAVGGNKAKKEVLTRRLFLGTIWSNKTIEINPKHFAKDKSYVLLLGLYRHVVDGILDLSVFPGIFLTQITRYGRLDLIYQMRAKVAC